MTSKKNRRINVTNDMLILTGGLAIPLVLLIGIATHQHNQDMGNLYTPGESIKKTERVEVDALQDSTLNARIAKYNELLRDYKEARDCAIAPNGHTQFMDRPVHPHYQTKMRAVYYAPRTLRDYKALLDQYAQDSIETRYQDLRDMLKATKAKQK